MFTTKDENVFTQPSNKDHVMPEWHRESPPKDREVPGSHMQVPQDEVMRKMHAESTPHAIYPHDEVLPAVHAESHAQDQLLQKHIESSFPRKGEMITSSPTWGGSPRHRRISCSRRHARWYRCRLT